jgi:arabinogalactan oligomer / maltooligosaccharide transport system substrate-binding protein
MKTRLWTLILLSALVVSSIAGCGPAATPTAEPVVVEPTQAPPPTEAPAAPSATLRIWADDTRTPILQSLAEKFLADYNVALVVEDLGVVQDIRAQVLIAVPAGEGPDIYIGVHDWLGALVESGLAAPLDLGAKADSFVPSTLDAFTYTDGKLYGVPYATENLGFFYNTDLVPEPPTTWDQVLETARALKAEGKVDYAIAIGGDPGYNSFPMQSAFGGYIFGKDEAGALNPGDIGLGSEGEITAVTWMRDAVVEGLMPETTDYDTNHALFETGKMPFLMAGPWALERIRASGVPYAIADSFPDNAAPLLGVQGFFVNPLSENVLLAQAFLTEYVATDDVMKTLYETGNRPSAFKSVLEITEDADLKAMGSAGANAVPMPNIPEMGSVWGAWNAGITIAITGQETPEKAMTDATQQIKDLIVGALKGMVNLPGSYQDKAGCGAAWDPACAATALTVGDDGLYRITIEMPAGDWEYKVALDGSWDVNYGSDGALNGPNYTISVAAAGPVTFVYDPATFLVTTE